MQTQKKRAAPLSFASITITLIAILSLFALTTTNTKIVFQSPTATYSGYFAVSYTGLYNYVDATPVCGQDFPPCLVPSETVFYLTTANATTIRLIFYCGIDYCHSPQQLHFSDGTKILVQGTLIVPSDWPTSKYHPTLQFTADLYVYNYTTAS